MEPHNIIYTATCFLLLLFNNIIAIPLSIYGEIQLFKQLYNILFTDIPYVILIDIFVCVCVFCFQCFFSSFLHHLLMSSSSFSDGATNALILTFPLKFSHCYRKDSQKWDFQGKSILSILILV